MKRYELPRGMRYSTLEERQEFYREEFSLKQVEGWLKDVIESPVFAVIIGRHTGIYPGKYRDDASTTILIDEYTNLDDVREQILEFL
ncbi:MAG: DNA primase, partial [Candidatus Bathyarchaeia archaeon]